MATTTIGQKLTGLQKLEKKIALQKGALLNEAIKSTNPNDLLKANEILTNIDPKTPDQRKSYILDPNDWQGLTGYKEKSISLNYGVLRRISYGVPIIRSIINTRIDQITSFCEPQSDKYSTGFVIRKKRGYFGAANNQVEPTKDDYKRMNAITEIIMNCGSTNAFDTDDFDTFTRKVMNDSLTFDQLNFDVVRNNRGGLYSYGAIDASTIRIADNGNANNGFDPYRNNLQRIQPLNRTKVKGYLPSYCQILDGAISADYYPWEMCFGVRNPTTNVYSNGYGVSEIEILINTVTSMLWAEEYNRKFFSQGSSPKGFIKIKGGLGVNNDKITQFKQQWQAMMSGVQNSHKTAILEGDVDWVDLQKTNREMEFPHWFEFLIKVACAIYRIDPAEVNFPLSGSADAKPMFEGNNAARLEHSKDKGLKPLLKFYQARLNKYIVSQIDPEYELVFVGLDDADPTTDITRDNLMVQNFVTIDEVRIKRGMKPLGEKNGGNVICNSVWLQNKTAGQQMELQKKQLAMQQDQQDHMQGQDEFQNDQQTQGEPEEDPFEKALTQYWDKLQKSE
jgi:hypothetical protein